jgi:hypothetical protein
MARRLGYVGSGVVAAYGCVVFARIDEDDSCASVLVMGWCARLPPRLVQPWSTFPQEQPRARGRRQDVGGGRDLEEGRDSLAELLSILAGIHGDPR